MTEARNRVLFSAGYAAATLLVIVPLAEGAFQAWPPSPSATEWRYGLVGYGGNNIALPILGGLLALITAAVLKHRRALIALSVLGLFTGLVLLVGIGSFSLDWLQLRQRINVEMLRPFDTSAFKALANLSFAVFTLGWAGVGGWRSAQAMARSKSEQLGERGLGVVAATTRVRAGSSHQAHTGVAPDEKE